MSNLRIYAENDSSKAEEYSSFDDIKEQLSKIGVSLELRNSEGPITDQSTQDEILKAYEDSVSKLMKERGFQTADVISVTPALENHPELRKKFLNEHTHSDDEARFFIDGKGLFCIHTDNKVFAMLCEKDDLINVPAGTKHWFDMGPEPNFKCIRVFTNQEGWVAEFTGNNIAEKFPRLEP